MSLKKRIDDDLKQSMLSGDKFRADTLKMVKSVILNEEISKNLRDQGLSDEAVGVCLKKELKKRKEASDLYKKANEQERSAIELKEASIISEYLPEEMPEPELEKVIDKVLEDFSGNKNIGSIGQIIGKVRKEAPNADGSMIAKLVKQKLDSN